jgi:hypothetical protein
MEQGVGSMAKFPAYNASAAAGKRGSAMQIVRVRVRRNGIAPAGPAWRFRRALQLMKLGVRPDASDDPFTRRLLRLLRLRGGLGPSYATPGVWRAFPYLEPALTIYTDAPDRRLIIEHGLVRGLDFDAISKWTGCPVVVVRAFAGFFFDRGDVAAYPPIEIEPLYRAAAG